MAFLGFLLLESSQAFSDEINYLIVEDITRPFQVTDKDLSKGGIISDIIDEIFKGSEHTVKHQVLPLKRLYNMIESRAVTNWIAYDAKVWNSLSKWGDFVDEPLFSVNHAYLTCQKNSFKQIHSAEDIKTHTIAVIKDFNYPELAPLQQDKTIQLQPVKSYKQGINLAGLNRVDGFVEMELRLRFNIQQESQGKPCFRFIDMSEIIPEYSIFLSLDKYGQSGLNTFVKKRIKALKKAGVIETILERYTQTELSGVVQGEHY